ncbi:MAG: glycosyltransferase [Candidatus Nanoarchaeia archaeon]
MELNLIEIMVLISSFFTLWALMYWFLYFIENRARLKSEASSEVPVLKTHPLVTIVVPAWNEEKHILKTLNSLMGLKYPDDKLEIIVVNDCSTDKTKQVAEQFIKNHRKKFARTVDIKLINHKKNKGKAEALNTALDVCKGEFFVCIDADSSVDEYALLHIMNMFQKDKSLAIATPVMKVDNPKTWIQKFQRVEYVAAILLMKLTGYMDCNFVAPGPFSTYKTAVLKKLGKFDGKHNLEDQEIAWRAQKNHYKIRQCSNAYVYTVAPNNLKKLSRQRTRWYRGSILTMYDYRSMFFNRKYGDFGVFQAPLTLLYFLLAIVSVVAAAYYLIKFLSKQITNLVLTNFDIWTSLQNLHFTFTYLDIDITKTLMLYILFLLTVLMLYFAMIYNNERMKRHGIFTVFYFFIFYLILGVILIKSLLEVVFRRKQKW